MNNKPIYSKCMSCGRVRLKGDKEWLPAGAIDEDKVLLSHGYCTPCAKVEEEKIDAELRGNDLNCCEV